MIAARHMHSPRSRLRPALMGTALLCTGAAAAVPVEPAALCRLVEDALVQRVSTSAAARGATRVEASASDIDSRLKLDACEQPLQVDVDLTRLQRRMNAKVSCAGPRPWSIYVPAEVRVYREVVVSVRELQAGAPLGPDDLGTADRDVLSATGTPLGSMDQALGQVVRRPVPANAIVTASMLAQQLVVRRGDHLTLRSQAGGITVQATAEALENGRTGDRIRVRNLQSQRTVDATVTGPGEASSP